MSRQQLSLNLLKSTINYELYKETGKIRKLKCEKSTDYIIKQFVYLRNNIKIIIKILNQLFYNIGYLPCQHTTIIQDRPELNDHNETTEYNIQIQWPNKYNKTHMCVIKGYFHYKLDIIQSDKDRYIEDTNKKIPDNLDICITMQMGILYDTILPDIYEKINQVIFIDKKPKLYQDMICNINRMMLYPKKYKIPKYLQHLIIDLHTHLRVTRVHGSAYLVE